MIIPSAAQVYALETELETERAKLEQVERELERMKEGARELESLKEGTARESEEIMGALQGQVDAANKVGRLVTWFSLVHPSPLSLVWSRTLVRLTASTIVAFRSQG